MDSRHFKRIKIVQEIYSLFFNPHENISLKSKEIVSNQETIDNLIKKAAPKYEIDKISKVDVAILRLAIYELLIEKKEPLKVVINEAIEIAKDMSSEKSPGFINAVLGKVLELQNEKPNQS